MRVAAKPKVEESYLASARDWVLQVDLDKRLKVPTYITETNLRPDMLLVSETTKQIGIIELTVPSEDRIEISTELKKTKYAVLEEACNRQGWRSSLWTVEVGSRGFPAQSLSSLLKDIGYTGRQRKTALRKIGMKAETASHSIWRWSHFKKWGS